MARALPGYEFEVETVGHGKKSRAKACVTLTMDRPAAEQLHRQLGRLLDEEERTTIHLPVCGQFVEEAPDEE